MWLPHCTTQDPINPLTYKRKTKWKFHSGEVISYSKLKALSKTFLYRGDVKEQNQVPTPNVNISSM